MNEARTRPSLGLLLAGSLGVLTSCGGAKTPPELAAVDADLGLGDVVMMTWTTREADGLLGHAMTAGEALGIDPHRRAMTGAEHFVPTDQTLSIVVSRDHTASLGAKYGPVGGEAAGAATTHIAYEVRITVIWSSVRRICATGPSPAAARAVASRGAVAATT